MDVNGIKERKLNNNIREGFRVLARIIVREYLKTQEKNDDREIDTEIITLSNVKQKQSDQFNNLKIR